MEVGERRENKSRMDERKLVETHYAYVAHSTYNHGKTKS